MADTSTKFAATTAVFNPQPLSIASHVLDATFVTSNPPDVERTAAVVALCPVPYNRQGMNDLGWHIRDFLAFKTLIASYVNPRTQTWFAQTNIEAAIKADNQGYAHGSDHRDVSGAAGGSKAGGDNVPILVEPSAKKLIVKFIAEVAHKARIAKEDNDPLVILICGLTTLEQDVVFDGDDYTNGVTSEQIRAAINDDSLRVILVTPSLTSAGWQVNPSFNQRPVVQAGIKPIDFMARQCGALFASNIVQHFLSWDSPIMDHSAIDQEVKSQESYPGPAKMTEKQNDSRAAFCLKIHALLAARLSTQHQDHSFSFDSKSDDWEKIVGPRKGRKLEKFATQWQQLGRLLPASTTIPKLCFLGDAFGGNKMAQINHIKHLIKESFNSWNGYYTTSFGQGIRHEMDTFLKRVDKHEELDCHAMFNILEHRLTIMVLGDLVVKAMNIQPVWNARCRDFDEAKLDKLVNTAERMVMSETFGDIHRNIPNIYMPPGRNFNSQSKIQILVRRASQYLAAALTIRYHEYCPRLQVSVGQIVNLLEAIQEQQIKVLSYDPEIQAMGSAWLNSIDIPAARFTGKDTEKPTTPVKAVQAPMNGISDGVNGSQLVTDNVSLLTKPKPFVPSIEAEAPTPAVKIEPPSPMAAANVMTPPQTFTPPQVTNIHESPVLNGQLKSRRATNEDTVGRITTPSPDKAKENVKPMPADEDLEKLTPKNGEKLKKLDVDDEAHLLPHLRRKYRPKTPVQQTETATTGTQSDKKSNSAVEKTPRKTPPHLRCLKTRG